MVYQTRAAHSSAKFRSYPLRNQRYCKEKRPQRYYKLPSVTESCDSGVKSEASEISIKICNADDENVVIQLFRNDTREQKQDRKKKKGQTQMMRQSAGGVHRQKHNTKNYHHSDKHQSHKNKCKCTEKTSLLHNLYRRTFGPTIDETLLAGMEALYNTCVPDCEEHGNYKPPELPEPPKKQPDKSQIDVPKYRRGRHTPDHSKTPESSSYQTIPDPSNTSVTTQAKSKHTLDFGYGLYSTNNHLKHAKRLNTQTFFMKHDNIYKKSKFYAKGDTFGEFSDPSAILSDIPEEINDSSNESEEKVSKSSSDPNILHSYSRKTVPLTTFAIKNQLLNCAVYKMENIRNTKSAIGLFFDNESAECQASSIVLSDTSKTVSNLPKQDSSKFSSEHIVGNSNGDYTKVKMKNKKTALSDADLPTIVSANKFGIVRTQFIKSNGTSFGFCSEPAAVLRCSVDFSAQGSGGDEQKLSATKSKTPRILSITSSSSQTPCPIISGKKVTKLLSKTQEEKSDLKVSDEKFVTNVYIPLWEQKKNFPTAYFKQVEGIGINKIMPHREKAGGIPERNCKTRCEINQDIDAPDKNYISSIIQCLRDIEAKRQMRLCACNMDNRFKNNSPSAAHRIRSLSLSSLETSSFSSTKSSFRSDCTECVNNLVETGDRRDKKFPDVVMFPTGQTFLPTFKKKIKLLKQSGDFFQQQFQNDLKVFCCKKNTPTDAPYMPAPVTETVEPVTDTEQSKVVNYDPETDVCDCDGQNPLVNEESQTLAPSFTDSRSKIPLEQPKRRAYYDSSENPSTKSTNQKTNESEFIELTSKKDNLYRLNDEECQDAVCEIKRRQALRKKKHIISSTSEPDLYSTQSELTEQFEKPKRLEQPNLTNQNTQTLESATSEPSLASLRRRPLEPAPGSHIEVKREKDEYQSVDALREAPSKENKSDPSQGISVSQRRSVSQGTSPSQGPSVRFNKAHASTEIFDMDGIRWRSIPTETSDEKIYPADLKEDNVDHYPLARKKCVCKSKELGVQVQPENSAFIKQEIAQPTQVITYPLSNNTEVQTDPVPLCCLTASTPEKLHSIKEIKQKLPIIRESEIKKEFVNSTNANKGNSGTNTITTASTGNTINSVYSSKDSPEFSSVSPTVVTSLNSNEESHKNHLDIYKMIMKRPESFVTNTVSLQEVIEKNTIPQETRFAITRVTKYADFTTYEVLKSTKARPKVIPCVTENIFIVKKKHEHDGTAPVHEL